MNYEWDARKATTNFAKHGVAFEDAASVFLDPLALTFPDPDHSGDEQHEITIGHPRSAGNMKKASATTTSKSLRAEYDVSKLQGGVRGKYYRLANSGTNLVLIEPDMAELFPDGKAVNRALRLLADAARKAKSS